MMARTNENVCHAIPEDDGPPAMLIYGVNAEPRFRNLTGTPDVHEAVIYELYGPDMRMVEMVSGPESAMIGAMARTGEQPLIPEVHHSVTPVELRKRAAAINMAIRRDALRTQSVDKGFHHYMSLFRPDEEVSREGVAERVLIGSSFPTTSLPMRSHRPSSGRQEWIEEDAAWEILEPGRISNLSQDNRRLTRKFSVSQRNVRTTLRGKETRCLIYLGLRYTKTENRKRLIEAFSLGFRKFVEPPYLSPFIGAKYDQQARAKQAASSRRHQVQDGVDYWVPVPVPPVTQSGEPFRLGRSIPDASSGDPAHV
jgi:hypothetical protein